MLKETQLSTEVWQAIPAKLKESGYYSAHEVAWFKKDALEVLDIIRKSGHGILGIDVMMPTRPGPTIPLNVYDLDLSELDGLKWEKRVAESHRRAVEFIRTFWNRADARIDFHGVEPVFNIWDWMNEEGE